MIVYTLYDTATGRIVSQHSATLLPGDFELPRGLAIIYDVPLHGRYRVVNGEFLEDTDPPPPRPYNELRIEDYPGIGQQLDALWHAMDDGTLPKVPAFYDPIKTVKTKYPKK